MADQRERWLVDGYELTQGNVVDVELRDGLYQTGGLAGENGNVPNRAGEVWRRKKRQAVGFVVNIWFAGDDRSDHDRQYADILQALGDGSRLPVWRRHMADGSVRQCRAEVVAALAPVAVGQTASRLSIEARAPFGVWEATVDAQSQTSLRPPSGTVLEMREFGDAITAPMDRLEVTISGPATNAKVIDATVGDGDSFTYAGTIPAGTSLTVNSGNWAINSAGFQPDRGALVYDGPRFLTTRTPQPRQYPKVRFEYANGGAGTRLTVTGRPTFAA